MMHVTHTECLHMQESGWYHGNYKLRPYWDGAFFVSKVLNDGHEFGRFCYS